MKSLVVFLRTTLVGGALFLLPLLFAVWLLVSGLKAVSKILTPVARLFPFEQVAGIAVAELIAAGLLLAVCFLAGLFGRTTTGRNLGQKFERATLKKVPGYTLLKSMTQDDLGSDGRVETALIRVDDGWVLAFIVERHGDGMLTVFVPSAPTPAAGTIYYMPEDCVRRLDLPVRTAAKLIMQLGVGSAEALRGKLDLTPGR
jgi:uncharacterized membrane protein